jgi:3-phosphoshikimate 1-carboxyvinyltransferase
MQALITPHALTGAFRIPASKSHTIRRLILASLTQGESVIENPLDSLDTRSAAAVCQGLGAGIDRSNPSCWLVQGTALPDSGGKTLDVGNSGTTLFLGMAAASLGNTPCRFTGDEQIRRRSASPLLDALASLGAQVASSPCGCAPLTVQGPLKGGKARLPCPTSQYLSALLLAAPLAPADTAAELEIPLLNEKPYITMTLSYLDAQGIPYTKAPDYSRFRIPGGAAYRPINGPVPGDFSSAAFAAAAGVTGGGRGVTLLGLDPADTQGDKAFFSMLSRMGAGVLWERAGETENEWQVTVSKTGPLKAGRFDLNPCPDLLPVMAVMGAYCEGETVLFNAAHARIKETDRVAVMVKELGKLGVAARELPDGLAVSGGTVSAGAVEGHRDHRVVMALAAAALGASGPLTINGAEAADVTYPSFLPLLHGSCVSS